MARIGQLFGGGRSATDRDGDGVDDRVERPAVDRDRDGVDDRVEQPTGVASTGGNGHGDLDGAGTSTRAPRGGSRAME